MKQTLPLSRWLTAPRPDETPVAWLGEDTWTLGHLRHDVAQLVKHLQQQEGERWALCFENSYLFIVALLATLHSGKTPVIPGHNRVSLLDEQRALFNGVLSDKTSGWHGPLLVVNTSRQFSAEAFTFDDIAADAFVELFTSGSTGQPKRIIKPIARLDCEAELLAMRFADRLAGCRVVASVVPQHLYGLTFRIFLPMALGLPLHAAMLYYAEQLAALVTDKGECWFDSPIIAEYIELLDIAPVMIPREPLASLKVRQIEVLADGIMDAGLVSVREQARPAAQQSETELLRQREKINRSLDALEGYLVDGTIKTDTVNLATIAIACAVGYLNFRRVAPGWCVDRPHLVKLVETLFQRESFARTEPPKA